MSEWQQWVWGVSVLVLLNNIVEQMFEGTKIMRYSQWALRLMMLWQLLKPIDAFFVWLGQGG